MNFKRIIAGKKAKFSGQGFETAFQRACELNQVAVVRIPDSCRRVAANQLIQVKSPFDFCMAYRGRSAHVDTKSTELATFSYSMIDQEQVAKLFTLSIGGPAGYVVGTDDEVYFIPVARLLGCYRGQSIAIKSCLLLGERINFNPSLIFAR